MRPFITFTPTRLINTIMRLLVIALLVSICAVGLAAEHDPDEHTHAEVVALEAPTSSASTLALSLPDGTQVQVHMKRFQKHGAPGPLELRGRLALDP